MAQILKKMNVLLDRKQKTTMVGLMFLMVIGAVLQTAGVGLLVQVVSVVVDPKAVETSALVKWFYDLLGCKDFKSFSVTVMALLIVVFAVKNIFLYVQQKATFAFIYTNQFRTSERMMRNYLRRGYEFFLNADTAVVQRSITSDVNNMYALILSLLQLMSDGVVTFFKINLDLILTTHYLTGLPVFREAESYGLCCVVRNFAVNVKLSGYGRRACVLSVSEHQRVDACFFYGETVFNPLTNSIC